MAHVLTITLSGLPELILVLQDAAQSIATSFSSSATATGSSLSCIPSEWSLLCHTMPYSLTLLEPNCPEWVTVLEHGKYVLFYFFLLYFLLLPLLSILTSMLMILY